MRLLQDHIQSLEVALQQQQQQQHQQETRKQEQNRVLSETAKPWSGLTVDSSRDGQGSLLSPSHLTGAREGDCREHVPTIVSLQSELKRLRAQTAADEDALVRAEREQAHLKREHATLTSDLLTAKLQQEELRQMVLDITDEKLQLQTATEAQQRTADRTVALLRQQLEKLERWRERHASRQRELEASCRPLTTERDNAKEAQQTAQRERDELAIRVHAADATLRKVKADLAVATATTRQQEQLIAELEHAMERAHREKRDANEALDAAQRQLNEMGQRLSVVLTEHESARCDCDALAATNRELVTAASRSQQEHARLVEEMARLREEKQRLEQQSLRWQRDAGAKQQQLSSMQTHVTQVEGQLLDVESELVSRSMAVETGDRRVEELEMEIRDLTRDLEQRQTVVSELERRVARQRERQHREELVSCRLEEQRLSDRLSAETSTLQQSLSLREANASLAQELSETKTTILMWMIKPGKRMSRS
ncbi:hypothetical protein P43SY_001919 [Pythium insidiosum]|uniref:Uncharacterized protein n=1 Tax=Pythium insidiosum TaxID=114742 RepID=A0AAD5LHL8_PYTIN|nr:hypothetical protein P43SY_001919 [Pythium insidiosum]